MIPPKASFCGKPDICVFLPTRKGSQRLKNKNTRQFANFKGGLLELKLEQLTNVSLASEIILSTNDETSLEIGRYFSKQNDKIRVIERTDHLAASSTNLTDLVKYVPTICHTDHILWTHVTSPFISTLDYENAIGKYSEALGNKFDSLMSTRIFKNYLWSREKKDIVNRQTPEKWPRTQDLRELFEIDSGIFIASKKIYEENHDRIGNNPYLLEQDAVKSFDIDWEVDFVIAEAIFEKGLID